MIWAVRYAFAVLMTLGSISALAAEPLLRGVNLGGLGTPGEQTPRLEAVDYYRSKGINTFRIPVQWELIQPRLSGPLDPVTVARLRSVIARAGSRSTIIIDVHNSGRYRGFIVGQTPLVSLGHVYNLWTRIAQTFHEPNIVYNVMNEPHGMSDTRVVAMMNVGIAGIRFAGRTNLILVSGNRWSNRASFGRGSTNWAMMSQIVDRGSKWAIDYHIYLDPWSAGQSAAVEAGWLAQVEQFTVEARAHRLRAFVGEWAVAADAASRSAGRVLRNHLEANPDVYIGWAWWAGGGWWPYNHIFRLDPYASQWDVTNPDRDWRLGGSSRASTWASPLIDRPQMAILTN